MTKQSNCTAILTKAADYRESDKLVRLFTVEYGVISAVMKGVKKAGAKLKFGSLPFAFCEYALTESKGYITVTGCTQIEDLFDITKDYESYLYASVMLEASDAAASGQANPALFTSLLRSLKDILFANSDPVKICGAFLAGLLCDGGFTAASSVPPKTHITAGDVKRLIRTAEKSYSVTINSAKLLF